MPTFYNDDDLDISPLEFLYSCSPREKQELIDLLVDDGSVRRTGNSLKHGNKCLSEQIFEQHLDSIYGKWHNLSIEDEEIIMNIAKKFK